ncbi:MAG: PTS fructose transporter subunit IIA [Clostridiales bacterium]|jgi:PTS system N-acetylgalactosamine-specific IIA component|nr:PTS fructose transporter subunit IIA [Clostridiales bacterium]
MNMVGFILTGHGQFAAGLLSAIEVVAGEQENMIGVDFLKTYSTEDLKEKLLEAVAAIRKECTEIIIFTDLKGGTPFNTSVMLKMEEPGAPIEVLCGTNFPMLLSGIFEREGVTAKAFAQSLVENGQSGVDCFVLAASEEKQADDDGI